MKFGILKEMELDIFTQVTEGKEDRKETEKLRSLNHLQLRTKDSEGLYPI